MPAPSSPNTSEVARRIGVTRAAASRFRAGMRIPQIHTRQAIASEFGWSLGEQVEAEAAGTWADEFNRVLAKAYHLTV